MKRTIALTLALLLAGCLWTGALADLRTETEEAARAILRSNGGALLNALKRVPAAVETAYEAEAPARNGSSAGSLLTADGSAILAALKGQPAQEPESAAEAEEVPAGNGSLDSLLTADGSAILAALSGEPAPRAEIAAEAGEAPAGNGSLDSLLTADGSAILAALSGEPAPRTETAVEAPVYGSSPAADTPVSEAARAILGANPIRILSALQNADAADTQRWAETVPAVETGTPDEEPELIEEPEPAIPEDAEDRPVGETFYNILDKVHEIFKTP